MRSAVNVKSEFQIQQMFRLRFYINLKNANVIYKKLKLFCSNVSEKHYYYIFRRIRNIAENNR
jgi:hypothetical protein